MYKNIISQYFRSAITIAVLLSSVFIFTGRIYAQVDSVKLNRDYVKTYYTDTRDFVTSPIRWQGKEWLKFTAFAGTTAALITIDKPVKKIFDKSHSNFLDNVSKYGFEPMGNYYAGAAIAGFFAYGMFADDSRSRSTALLTAESFIISGVLVRIPKYLAGRPRPDTSDSPWEWQGPFNGKSFPSGHTTSAFAVASVIAYQYKETLWVPITAYSLATLTGVSRIYDNKHWLSDVFAGAVIGTITGRFICKQHENNHFSIGMNNFNGINGVCLVYKW
ncbi:MAG: phosphatase PAP2 family protein [Prolixibacteraceae bacterium]|nr:phosphatase PAP2 family protein [Prolixibacteraceae bacterium]